jgi:hypothetical protein
MATHTHPARTHVLVGIAATIAFLAAAALLTPEQSPILPIEISVVLAALGAWFGLRGSRTSLAVLTVFATLLVLLTVHITGDVGSSGARELVPDFLILISSGFVAGRGVLGLVRKPVHA